MKYRVTVDWWATSYIEVEADSRMEARDLAKDMFQMMGEGELIRCTTIPSGCMDRKAEPIGD